MKKILLALGAAGTVLVTMPMFAAFEAHVVNVTAKIENALTVPVKFLEFGTVFPQEALNKEIGVTLSRSFIDEGRVDDITYHIRQKPKCAITSNDGQTVDLSTGENGVHIYTGTGEVVIGDNPTTTPDVETSYIDCGPAPRELTQGETWGVLPSLCPFLSKHEITTDGTAEENDGPDAGNGQEGINAFHVPYTIDGENINWLEALGKLTKIGQDTEDNWNIDLRVPCFTGSCAQDWDEFVLGNNPNANPADYTLDPADEHKVFGCDLWFEVNGVSTTTTPTAETTITVTKIVNNNNGGNLNVGDFQLRIDGNPVTSGAPVVVTPGAHTVSEDGVNGYSATLGGACAANGSVNAVEGQNTDCTITNDDVGPSITLTKIIAGGGPISDPDFFDVSINGNVVISGSTTVVNAGASYVINEEVTDPDYDVTAGGDLECPIVLGGSTTVLGLAESISCTITNTFDGVDDNQ